MQKHPRSRGEDIEKIAGFINSAETPPLTRGRLPNEDAPVIGVRNTPAHAGKTRWRRPHRCRPQKHPRSRGEDLHTASSSQSFSETPPLTRGRQPIQCPCVEQAGNTPAHAGKTLTYSSMRFRFTLCVVYFSTSIPALVFQKSIGARQRELFFS